MKIKAKIECWTPAPEKKWSAGEIKEIPEKEANKLLRNANFERANKGYQTESLEAESKGVMENVKYRKKRSIGDRN